MKAHAIEFADDELALLHLLLSRELESSRVELHHTAGLPYREYIKRRMEQVQALLKKMDNAPRHAEDGQVGIRSFTNECKS